MLSLLVAACVFLVSVSCDQGQPEVVLFNQVDTNDNDQLTRIELWNAFMLFDNNTDNIVTPTELVTGWTVTYNLGNAEEAQNVFTKADVNDDGYIDIKDLPAIYDFFDQNGDGVVDISEFLTQISDLEETPPDESNVSVDITG